MAKVKCRKSNRMGKEFDLWYATRPMREGEIPETTTFQEKSALGIVEGTVIFIESN